MEGAIQQSLGGFMSTAHRLSNSGLNVNSLRTNALLRKDEWKRLDDAVVNIARGRLVGIQDLQSAGLTRDLGGLGVLIAEYEKVGDMEPAEQSLAGVTEGEEDIPDYTLAGVPVPITHKDFRVNIRHLEASRTRGQSIDVTAAEIAARRVAEKLEDTLFNGSDIRIGSSTLPGYTTFTDRITGALTAAWSAGATTGQQIVDDVNAMITALEAKYFTGPFVLYVPTGYLSKLREDYITNYPKTIMQRLLEIDNLQAVRSTIKLTGNNVVMVQLTSDVVDLPVAQDITTVEWDQKGGLQTHFKVMAAMAPRLKSDANGATGIAHYSV